MPFVDSGQMVLAYFAGLNNPEELTLETIEELLHGTYLRAVLQNMLP